MLELIQVSTGMASPYKSYLYKFGSNVSSDISYTKYSSDLNLGEGLCICTSYVPPAGKIAENKGDNEITDHDMESFWEYCELTLELTVMIVWLARGHTV